MNKSSLLVLLFCFSATFAAVPVAMNCPDGWKWFIRSRGGWCMKVFVETLVQEKAEEKCVAQGATIAGVQNANESAWMRSEFESQYKTPAYMWVGGKRIKPCLNSGLTSACSRVTSFYWTDKSTVGVQGFTWKEGEPNNHGGGGQWCLQLMSNTGLMDDVNLEIQAEAKCEEHGAFIAGVQITNESSWMAADLESFLKAPGYFWIGAKRITPCRYVGITNRCSQITWFYWIDESTVGVQGFRWLLSEPNNVNGTQGCVAMESTSLLMDDLRWSDKSSGYVCGKVASFD